MNAPLASAAVVGGTGLVGRELLKLLLEDDRIARVVTLGRRATGFSAPKLVDVTTDLGAPALYREHLDVDCVFCTLGTTIKQAGSQEAFRRIDFDYPLALAREASAVGARCFAIVTAVGVSAKSSIFYNRVKGELEDELATLRFPRGLRFLHPSLILGDRTEPRAGERVGAVAMAMAKPFLAGGLKKYRAIEARDLARAMVTSVREADAGTRVYEGEALFAAARA